MYLSNKTLAISFIKMYKGCADINVFNALANAKRKSFFNKTVTYSFPDD